MLCREIQTKIFLFYKNSIMVFAEVFLYIRQKNYSKIPLRMLSTIFSLKLIFFMNACFLTLPIVFFIHHLPLSFVSFFFLIFYSFLSFFSPSFFPYSFKDFITSLQSLHLPYFQYSYLHFFLLSFLRSLSFYRLYNSLPIFKLSLLPIFCPVSWGCRIH